MPIDSRLYSMAVEWEKELQKARHASKIYLDRARMEALALEIRRYLYDWKRELDIILVVLAVNCAYHYYDDNGFWFHFCRLLNIENTVPNQKMLGDRIERKLQQLGLNRTKRSGPFRYVGSILEQCGISRRYAGVLAGIIKDLKGQAPWIQFITMDYKQFRRKIRALDFSQYLKDFLNDPAGWEFTMQVCQVLMLYEQGYLTLDELKELPGYPPGFWTEFLNRFINSSNNYMEKKIESAPLRPWLVLLPGERCLALWFPAREYVHSVRYPNVNVNWNYPVTILDDSLFWADCYAGHITLSGQNKGEWYTPGWLPDGLPVLFDAGGRYIQRGSKINQGEYWLVIPEGYTIPCRVLSRPFRLRVPGSTVYKACRVEIDGSTSIHGYIIENETDTDMTLTWVQPEEWLLWCALPCLDVFSGSIPELSVSNLRMLEQGTAIMYYMSQYEKHRIRSRQELEYVMEIIKKRAPVCGRFIVYAVGRTGRPGVEPVIAEKVFVLLPDVRVDFERRLYSFSEEPIVTVNEKFQSTLNLEGCIPEDGESRKWRIPVSRNRVTGTLDCCGVKVGIEIPVYRARLCFRNRNIIRYMLTSEINHESEIYVSGLPETSASLGLYQQPDVAVDIEFDENGMAQINQGRLLELYKDPGHPVNEIILTLDGTTVSTGACIIDLSALKTSIFKGDFSDHYKAAGDLFKILELCAAICRGFDENECEFNLNRIPQFNPQLDKMVFSIFACASVFDGIDILVSGGRVDWKHMVDSECFIELLDCFVRGEDYGCHPRQISGMIDECFPAVERWRKCLQRYIEPKTKQLEDLLGEWASEVKRHQTNFRSRISRTPDGYKLSQAWVSYHCGSFSNALSHLYDLKPGLEIHSDLYMILCGLLYLRMARIREARKTLEAGYKATLMADIYTLLEYIVKTLNGERTGIVKPIDTKNVALIPLRKEDLELFRIAVLILDGRGMEITSSYNEFNDWLQLFFMIVAVPGSHEKIKMVKRFIQLKDSIPQTPDIEYIISKAI